MSIRYICPKCGSDVSAVVLLCCPPIDRYECTNWGKCDYLHEEREVEERIVAPSAENHVQTIIGGDLIYQERE